jgi:hypothetical protein
MFARALLFIIVFFFSTVVIAGGGGSGGGGSGSSVPFFLPIVNLLCFICIGVWFWFKKKP